MGDQKPVIGPFERGPATDPRCRTRPQQIDRRTAPEIVPTPILRKMPFMRPPAELGGLRALADKAVDRPGVDEFARLFGDRRDLRVALGDMDDLEAELLGQNCPIGAPARGGNAGVRW